MYRLSATLLILNLQSSYSIPNIHIDALLRLLGDEILPQPNTLPRSYLEARQVLKEVGMEYNIIHCCANMYYLYRGSLTNAIECPQCNNRALHSCCEDPGAREGGEQGAWSAEFRLFLHKQHWMWELKIWSTSLQQVMQSCMHGGSQIIPGPHSQCSKDSSSHWGYMNQPNRTEGQPLLWVPLMSRSDEHSVAHLLTASASPYTHISWC